MWLNFKSGGLDSMFIYWPIILVAVSAVLLFSPIKVLYHRSRMWWALSNVSNSLAAVSRLRSSNKEQGRLFAAPLYAVEFRDFLLGDMYCSLAYTMAVSFRAMNVYCYSYEIEH